jgi:hypothetical protein
MTTLLVYINIHIHQGRSVASLCLGLDTITSLQSVFLRPSLRSFWLLPILPVATWPLYSSFPYYSLHLFHVQITVRPIVTSLHCPKKCYVIFINQMLVLISSVSFPIDVHCFVRMISISQVNNNKHFQNLFMYCFLFLPLLITISLAEKSKASALLLSKSITGTILKQWNQFLIPTTCFLCSILILSSCHLVFQIFEFWNTFK